MKKIILDTIVFLLLQTMLFLNIVQAADLPIKAKSCLSPSLEISSISFEPYMHAYELVANLSTYRILQGKAGDFDLKIYEVIAKSRVTHLATFNKTRIFLVGDENQRYLFEGNEAYIDFKKMLIFVARGAHLTDPYIVHKEYRVLRAFVSFARKKHSKSLLDWINRHPQEAQSRMRANIRYVQEQHKKEPIFEKRISAKVNKVGNKKTVKFVFNFLGRRFSFYPGKEGYYYRDLKEEKILIRGYFHKIDVLRYSGDQRLELIGSINFLEGKIIYNNGQIYPEDKYYVEVYEIIPAFLRIKNIFSNRDIHNKGGIFYLDAGKIRWRFSIHSESLLYYYLKNENVFMSRDVKDGAIEIFIKTKEGEKAVLATIKVNKQGNLVDVNDKEYLHSGKKVNLFAKREKILYIPVEHIMRLSAQFFLLESMRSDAPIAEIKRYADEGKLENSDIISFIYSKKFNYLKPENLKNGSVFFVEALNAGCFSAWVMPDFGALFREERLILKVAKENDEYNLEKVFQLLQQQNEGITFNRFYGLLRSLRVKCRIENFEAAMSANGYMELEILAALFFHFQQDHFNVTQVIENNYLKASLDWLDRVNPLEVEYSKHNPMAQTNKSVKMGMENSLVPNPKLLGDMVKKYAEIHHLSIDQFSAKIGMSSKGLKAILGKNNKLIKVKSTQKIAIGLGIIVENFTKLLFQAHAVEQSI